MPTVNWEAIGAIGEILGAVAVLLTLVYLARQVADAKKAIRRQASNDINKMFNDAHHVMASSPELAGAMAKLEAGVEISGAERYHVRAMFMAQMNAFENMYIQAREADDFLGLTEIHAMVLAFLEEPWVGNYWDNYMVYFSEDFKRFVSDEEGI